MNWQLISAVALGAGLVKAASAQKGRHPDGPSTMPSVDLSRYAGTWHEIARLPNRFEKECSNHVTATYTPQPDGTLRVVNRCETAEGKQQEAAGVAKVAKEGKTSRAVLKVRFAPALLSFLPNVWGDYRILMLDEDYRYALVGTRYRKFLWILSRTPQLSEDIVQRLLTFADGQGFDTKRVIRTH